MYNLPLIIDMVILRTIIAIVVGYIIYKLLLPHTTVDDYDSISKYKKSILHGLFGKGK